MKLEIELDLNKIDYDTINKQIQEKVEALNITEIPDIENKISIMLNQILREVYTEYFNSGYTKTYNGEAIVQNAIKEKFTEIVRKVIDDTYKEDKIKEIIEEIFPRLFVQAMYDSLYDGIKNLTACNKEITINHAVNIVADRLNSRGIQM